MDWNRPKSVLNKRAKNAKIKRKIRKNEIIAELGNFFECRACVSTDKPGYIILYRQVW